MAPPSTTYHSALLIAVALAAHGLRKGSLSTSGAIAAFIVGYGHLANPLKVFGVTLIFFYLAGSRATKIKVHQKAKLEDGPNPLKPGGNRSALQVVSNCIPSLLAALYYRFGLPFFLQHAYCPLDRTLPKQLVYVALAQLATNFGDTLASELGILASSQPYYILTFERVPAGTNGGVSLYGLVMSALGGAAIGLVMVIDLMIERTCYGTGWAVEMILFGTAAGFLGSMASPPSCQSDIACLVAVKAAYVDTVLGATLQETLYSTKDGRILTDLSHRPGERVKRIGVGRDILSNSTVNFLSGAIMAGVGWYYAAA